jgi:hypothetical protein
MGLDGTKSQCFLIVIATNWAPLINDLGFEAN